MKLTEKDILVAILQRSITLSEAKLLYEGRGPSLRDAVNNGWPREEAKWLAEMLAKDTDYTEEDAYTFMLDVSPTPDLLQALQEGYTPDLYAAIEDHLRNNQYKETPMVWRNSKTPAVTRCPSCGSTDIDSDQKGPIECYKCGGHRVGRNQWADGDI